MNGNKRLWNSHLATGILRRQSYEDLNAGVYDSYLMALRAIRSHIGRLQFADSDERGKQIDAELVDSIRDERPLVPIYNPEWPVAHKTVGAGAALLRVYRVRPHNGEVIPGSSAVAAYMLRSFDNELQAGSHFTGDQVHLLLEHHEELLEAGLVPHLPK